MRVLASSSQRARPRHAALTILLAEVVSPHWPAAARVLEAGSGQSAVLYLPHTARTTAMVPPAASQLRVTVVPAHAVSL